MILHISCVYSAVALSPACSPANVFNTPYDANGVCSSMLPNDVHRNMTIEECNMEVNRALVNGDNKYRNEDNNDPNVYVFENEIRNKSDIFDEHTVMKCENKTCQNGTNCVHESLFGNLFECKNEDVKVTGNSTMSGNAKCNDNIHENVGTHQTMDYQGENSANTSQNILNNGDNTTTNALKTCSTDNTQNKSNTTIGYNGDGNEDTKNEYMNIGTSIVRKEGADVTNNTESPGDQHNMQSTNKEMAQTSNEMTGGVFRYLQNLYQSIFYDTINTDSFKGEALVDNKALNPETNAKNTTNTISNTCLDGDVQRTANSTLGHNEVLICYEKITHNTNDDKHSKCSDSNAFKTESKEQLDNKNEHMKAKTEENQHKKNEKDNALEKNLNVANLDHRVENGLNEDCEPMLNETIGEKGISALTSKYTETASYKITPISHTENVVQSEDIDMQTVNNINNGLLSTENCNTNEFAFDNSTMTDNLNKNFDLTEANCHTSTNPELNIEQSVDIDIETVNNINNGLQSTESCKTNEVAYNNSTMTDNLNRNFDLTETDRHTATNSESYIENVEQFKDKETVNNINNGLQSAESCKTNEVAPNNSTITDNLTVISDYKPSQMASGNKTKFQTKVSPNSKDEPGNFEAIGTESTVNLIDGSVKGLDSEPNILNHNDDKFDNSSISFDPSEFIAANRTHTEYISTVTPLTQSNNTETFEMNNQTEHATDKSYNDLYSINTSTTPAAEQTKDNRNFDKTVLNSKEEHDTPSISSTQNKKFSDQDENEEYLWDAIQESDKSRESSLLKASFFNNISTTEKPISELESQTLNQNVTNVLNVKNDKNVKNDTNVTNVLNPTNDKKEKNDKNVLNDINETNPTYVTYVSNVKKDTNVANVTTDEIATKNIVSDPEDGIYKYLPSSMPTLLEAQILALSMGLKEFYFWLFYNLSETRKMEQDNLLSEIIELFEQIITITEESKKEVEDSISSIQSNELSTENVSEKQKATDIFFQVNKTIYEAFVEAKRMLNTEKENAGSYVIDVNALLVKIFEHVINRTRESMATYFEYIKDNSLSLACRIIVQYIDKVGNSIVVSVENLKSTLKTKYAEKYSLTLDNFVRYGQSLKHDSIRTTSIDWIKIYKENKNNKTFVARLQDYFEFWIPASKKEKIVDSENQQINGTPDDNVTNGNNENINNDEFDNQLGQVLNTITANNIEGVTDVGLHNYNPLIVSEESVHIDTKVNQEVSATSEVKGTKIAIQSSHDALKAKQNPNVNNDGANKFSNNKKGIAENASANQGRSVFTKSVIITMVAILCTVSCLGIITYVLLTS